MGLGAGNRNLERRSRATSSVLWGITAWCLLGTACARTPLTAIVGDSIGLANCCSTVGPSDYLVPSVNLAVNGNQIARVTALLPSVKAERIYVHVGVNDIWRDNPHAERDLSALLAAIRAHPALFVVDEIGPLRYDHRTPAREALRARMNRQLRAFKAPHVRVVPFVATSLPDGLHPDNEGYAQQMPVVVAAFR